MSGFYYEGETRERIDQAIKGMEERCRSFRPDAYKEDLLAFAEQQIPHLTDKNKQSPRWCWPENQPPPHLKYVLDSMWYNWGRARVRWGDIIHELKNRYSLEQTQ